MKEDQEAAGQDAVLLTDLLTRQLGTGRRIEGSGDSDRSRVLLSETYWHARDEEDVRRVGG
jgi:hypothetical protein